MEKREERKTIEGGKKEKDKKKKKREKDVKK